LKAGIAFPAAVVRATTWNLELEREVGRQVGREMLWARISVWLAPGLNIHRNPLGGRNAEYYSEDPLLAGVVAAVVKGVQCNNGVGATLKALRGERPGSLQVGFRFYSF
jgi:beta-glucosidase